MPHIPMSIRATKLEALTAPFPDENGHRRGLILRKEVPVPGGGGGWWYRWGRKGEQEKVVEEESIGLDAADSVWVLG